MTDTARRENPARRALLALETLRVLGNAAPTPAQRERLLDWPGWGALAPAFSLQPKSGWLDVADRLEQSFGDRPGDLKIAADHLDTSFFTPPEIIDAMFGLLRSSGFTGGSLFEPGCGSGRFMAHAPSDLVLEWTGVEIDPTAARIARALNPKAQIITSALQDISLRAGAFDVAIGNVPFAGRGSVYDPAYGTATSLHGYFMLRAFDAVRVGGLVMIITSRNVMDSAQMMAQAQRIGDLVGAVRLPSGAFASSGTEVVTDLVVFQKRDAQLPPDLELHDRPSASTWGAQPNRLMISTPATPGKGAIPVAVSTYWRDNPELVAGEMAVTGFPQNPLVVLSDDHDRDIRTSMSMLSARMPALPARTSIAPEFGDVILTDEEGRKEGSFHIVGDEVHQVISGSLVQLPRAPRELRSLIVLRDASLALIDAESDPTRTDATITPLRDLARGAYLDYAEKYGALNRGALHEGAVDPDTGLPALSYRRPTMGGFRQDPDYVTVLAMEEFDQEIGAAAPAPILLHRVNKTPDRATSAASAVEALSIVRGEGRGLDLARIGDLIGERDPGAVIEQLQGHIFRTPGSDDYVLAVDYLSGNVRQKLADATAAADVDPTYAANVEALRAVTPDDLGPLDIRISLGAPWIAPAYVEKFVQEVFLGRVKIAYTAPISYWELTNNSGDLSPDITLTWGTPDAGPLRLLELALNGKAPVITEEVMQNGKLKKVKRPAETMAAEAKQGAVQERFAEWVWEDAARTEAICREYNHRFNSYVVRKPDGAHLTFPGMSEDFTLWPHQRAAIDGMVSNARYMVGHAVGAGKTTDMVAGAMTLRRFGLANKPMIAVPNHLLEQVAREAKQLYPTGKFLIAGREDLQGSGRRLFAARCATGSWDAVILTHQALVSLPVAPAVEEAWIEEKKSELRAFLQDDSAKTSAKRGAKIIAQAIRRLDAQLAELRDNKNTDKDMILFEHLGVDHVSVDEAHAFKRLPITTRAEGFSLGSSKRATDLLLKINTLAERRPGKPIVTFFTGTPWSNTLAETFVWQTYLQPKRLEEMGVAHFDAWAATFVRYENRVEVTPDGSGFRMSRRPVAIQNFPEMRTIFAEIADLLPSEALDLVRPTATVTNFTAPSTEAQKRFVADLAERAEMIRLGDPRRMGEAPDDFPDNMLLICGDGRKVALDPVLVDIIEASPKVEMLADEVARTYHEGMTVEYGGARGHLQLVFADFGTPHPDDSQTYGRVKAALVARGVPAERVRFIHEAKSDKARHAVFSACRDGSISILLGSTEKLGTGTNVQRRLRALHHLDTPWRASDMEQRNGRGIRPGNLNTEVAINRYVTQGSFDGYMYQLVEKKQRFMSQLYRVDATVREIEDIADLVLSYGEVKALAAGNPLLLEQSAATAELKRLQTLRTLHNQAIKKARQDADQNERLAQTLNARVIMLDRARSALKPDTNELSLDALAGAISRDTPTANGYRGLELRYRSTLRDGGDQPRNLTIESSRFTVHTIDIPDRTFRRGPAAIRDHIHTEVTAWADGLDKLRDDTLERQQEMLVRIDESRAAATKSAPFPLADALHAARAKLSRIEEALAEAAEPTSEPEAEEAPTHQQAA